MCDKCGNTGLIPFIGKVGKVVPGTFLHCSCHRDYGSKAHDCGTLPTRGRRPSVNWNAFHRNVIAGKKKPGKMRVYEDDFDFPCSETFRGYYTEIYAEHPVSAVTASREVVREVVIERQPANMLPIKSELTYLKNKLNEHIDAAKKAAQKKQGDYY